MTTATLHKETTKAKIGLRMHRNKNAEKFGYEYTKNLFLDAYFYAQENECFVLVQVATALDVPKKRFSYLANKYPDLKGLYLMVIQIMEINVYELTNTNRMPVRLAIFLLNYAYGYAKKIKENRKRQEQERLQAYKDYYEKNPIRLDEIFKFDE